MYNGKKRAKFTLIMNKHKNLVQPNAERNLERLIFFSDAVIAIAITLLALDLQVPAIPAAVAAGQLPDKLFEMLPVFMMFFISFLVIGIFWISHHRIFGYIERYDDRLIWLNLLFLVFIVLLPFTTRLLGQYTLLPLVNVLYALTVVGCSAGLTLLWWYASHKHRLTDQNLDPRLVRSLMLRPGITAVIFALSIPVAYYNIMLTQMMWWGSIFVSSWFGSRARPHQHAGSHG